MWLRQIWRAILNKATIPSFQYIARKFPKLMPISGCYFGERVYPGIIRGLMHYFGWKDYVVKFEKKYKSHLKRKVTNYKSGLGTYTGDVYGYVYPQPHGKGYFVFPSGHKYEGEFKDGNIFIDRPKAVKPNDIHTEVFMSTTMASENRKDEWQWGAGRFDGGETINRHTVSTAEELLIQLEQLQEVNEEHNKKIRIVFNQHGDVNGYNNIGITQVHAKKALQILASKGYKDVVISDITCHGGTAFHFHKIAQEFVDSTGVRLRINSSREGSIVYAAVQPDANDLSQTMATFRMLDKNGKAKQRLRTTYMKNKVPQIVAKS